MPYADARDDIRYKQRYRHLEVTLITSLSLERARALSYAAISSFVERDCFIELFSRVDFLPLQSVLQSILQFCLIESPHKHIRPLPKAYPAYSTIMSSFAPGDGSPAARMTTLRAVPAEELLQAHLKTFSWGALNVTTEEGPNAIWKESAIKTIKEGQWDEWVESVVLGTNEDEGSFFAYVLSASFHFQILALWALNAVEQVIKPGSVEKYIAQLPPPMKAPLMALYPESPSLSDDQDRQIIEAPVSRLLADQIFEMPALHMAHSLSRPSARSGRPCDVYLYRNRAEVDKVSRGILKFGSMSVVLLPPPPSLFTLFL